ncbi:xyloglucan-specific endoglucanase [Colletotrichum truncatum]|uniref:Xyloglucan-specific endoglucanase n=1 Tax=Colletotrichum truncatum TaxID=5467 RepID=A0ACC3YSH4_COLTU
MNVTSFNNQTYASNTTAPEFWVTWWYPRGPETQPVHAFPNVKVDGTILPVAIPQLSKIQVDVEWSYAVGNYTTDGAAATDTDAAELTSAEIDANTNVAIDMFLDDDKETAKDGTKAAYEVMVWLATFGTATQPIGYKQGTGVISTATVNGTTFSLYAGQNSLKQYVLTWVASATTEHFVGDLTPLVKKLTDSTITSTASDVKFPSSSTYLGYMGLGSEALSAKKVITFRVPTLSIDIE